MEEHLPVSSHTNPRDFLDKRAAKEEWQSCWPVATSQQWAHTLEWAPTSVLSSFSNELSVEEDQAARSWAPTLDPPVTSRWCNYLTNPKHRPHRHRLLLHELHELSSGFKSNTITMIVTITKGTSLTCIVAESLTKKTPPSLSPISRSVASCRDIAPKYQLKILGSVK